MVDLNVPTKPMVNKNLKETCLTVKREFKISDLSTSTGNPFLFNLISYCSLKYMKSFTTKPNKTEQIVQQKRSCVQHQLSPCDIELFFKYTRGHMSIRDSTRLTSCQKGSYLHISCNNHRMN